VFTARYGLIPYMKHVTFRLLKVKLSDFTVWRHTWRKNWVNYTVLTGHSAGLRTVLSSRLSHRELRLSHRQLRSSLRESHSFLSLPAGTTKASSQGTPFVAIRSADEYRIIYSFSNTISYSTFYAFFSSFRIPLWPMWPANIKRQPCFCPLVTRTKRHTELTKHLTNLMGNLCCSREHSLKFFVQVVYTVKLHSLT
jgi:hypothetical protein